jgi:leucyl aminopeptidase
VNVQATTDGPLATEADTIAVGVFEQEGVAHDVGDGALTALLESGEAKRKRGHVAVVHAEGRRFILAGLGDRTGFDAEQARVVAAGVHGRARELSTRCLCWEVPHHVADEVVAGLVEGTALHAYRFDRYKPEQPPQELERLILSAHHDVSRPVEVAATVSRAQNRARDLANTPANDLTPVALAEYALGLDGIAVSVVDGDGIRALGMGAFAAVAQGSREDARLIRLEYDGGGPADESRIALIGKAVTFDSGGLSMKSPANLVDMKFDMAGGAAVIEAIVALAELGVPARVLGLVAASENLPGDHAIRPGDIVRALDGTTIEIDNTDAEGRLLLADCLALARREGCRPLIDIATLTGAVVAALGSVYAGLFSNDDALAAEVERCGLRTGELVWRLPLHPDYARMTEGRYAQFTNRPTPRVALASSAAALLHHFAGPTPWAHLDIAGTGWDVRRAYLDKRGTGFGVRLLVELVTALVTPESR